MFILAVTSRRSYPLTPFLTMYSMYIAKSVPLGHVLSIQKVCHCHALTSARVHLVWCVGCSIGHGDGNFRSEQARSKTPW